MRKCLTLLLCLLLAFGLAGCGGSDQGAGNKVKKSSGVDEVLEAGVEEEEKKTESEVSNDGNQSAVGDDDSQAVADESSQAVASESSQAPAGESSQGDQTDQTELQVNNPDVIDVDLTTLSSTMVYSEVYNMVTTPDNYVGETVKMKGTAASIHDESTGKYYYTCIIQDATACCSQGIEYVLADAQGPQDYPADGEEITVTGIYDTYEEADMVFCTLRDAKLLK